MKPFRLYLLTALSLLWSALLPAQTFAPPPAQAPDDATLKAIAAKTEKLGKALVSLRIHAVRDLGLAEAEVYHKAATWIVRHGEFYPKDAASWTLAILDDGLLRASQLAQGETPWLQQTGRDIARAYRSRVDGSIQPYAVTFPEDYGKSARKKWRLDVVLHGRDSSLTEVKFLYQHNGTRTAPKDQDFVRLDIFGRVNNAYRWAGETDVFEAIESFLGVERLLGRDGLLDPARVVLRGFSMGGAGSWHLGLHHPDRWCVIGPGAGFSTTRGYIKNLPEQLPSYQEKCLHIYDAVDYAENAFDVPVVAYAGSKDAQLQAAQNIQARLKPLGIPMTLLIGPDLAHQFPPEWQQKAEIEYLKYAGPGKGRQEYPKRVRFVTYTLRYPACAWVELFGLERHYDQARIDAEKTDTGFTVQTVNVRSVRLGLPEQAVFAPLQVKIDGQELKVLPYRNSVGTMNVYLERERGRWQAVMPQKLLVDYLRRPQKLAGLQGPIDDAFLTSFLCVRGTGKPWHSATHRYIEADLQRFSKEWDKYLRGDLPIKDDVDVTEEDITAKHLVLFGDPSSNALLAQLLDRLPLTWTKEAVGFSGQSYNAAEHVPVLIYPSPLNTTRYVVLNSGHTFHAADFQGTNALLYPRLGDYAILQLSPGDKDPLAVRPAIAGLFDDFWQVGKP